MTKYHLLFMILFSLWLITSGHTAKKEVYVFNLFHLFPIQNAVINDTVSYIY